VKDSVSIEKNPMMLFGTKECLKQLFSNSYGLGHSRGILEDNKH
jgi:hypothetical protein